MSLDVSRPEDRQLAAQLVEELRHRFIRITEGKRTRDFCNSLPHRVKTRALQSVLVLLPLLEKEHCEELLLWACECVVQDQQQPSVRYLLEWTMASVVIHWPVLSDIFFGACTAGVSKRSGSVASFLASISLLAVNADNEKLIEKCLSLTVPWCMSQQYNTRLYAQLTLGNLWNRCEALQLSATQQKYSVVYDSMLLSNARSVMDDFFFAVFHPVDNFSLQTIYYELPRLSLCSDDEWTPSAVLLEAASLNKIKIQSSIPAMTDADQKLKVSSPASWVTKATKVGGEALVSVKTERNEVQPTEAHTGNEVNMQRKVVPWSTLGNFNTVEGCKQSQGVGLFTTNITICNFPD